MRGKKVYNPKSHRVASFFVERKVGLQNLGQLPRRGRKALLKVMTAPARRLDQDNSDRGKRPLWLRKSTPNRHRISQAFAI